MPGRRNWDFTSAAPWKSRGASRIGHGYELPYENDMGTLLAGMAQKRIAVEINLTSNDITPGVKGGDHPLHLYLKAGVPVVLSAGR